MPRRSTSARWESLPRSKRIAPNTRGVSVFTRPPRISGAPDHCAIDVTSMPLSPRCFAVPPVERISTSFARSARASSTMPVLSETERMARSIRMHFVRRAHAAARHFPDEEVEVDVVRDRVRVADRGNTKSSRPVVERCSISARILLGHQRRVAGRSRENLVEIRAQHEVAIESVEHRREAGQTPFEVLLEIRALLGIVIADVKRFVRVPDGRSEDSV